MTNEEKQELLNAMKADSQSVDNLEVVTSLDGVKSLPAVRGEELVSAPLNLLSKPSQDAAATANSAAATANEAAAKAIEAATNAETKGEQAEKAAATATEAASKATDAVSAANTVAGKYEHSAKLGLDGATARFAAVDETTGITTEQTSLIASAMDLVVWSVEKKTFLLRSKDRKYYISWSADGSRSMDLFLDGQTVKQDKVYACGESLYVYSGGDLVEISGSGGGNTYNVTTEALRTSAVSDAVKACFRRRTTVERSLKRTPADYVVAHVCLVFELVYPLSAAIARAQGYADRLMDFPSENPDTRAWFEEMRQTLWTPRD